MDEYWDAEDRWVNEARCICGERVADNVFVCSATCADIQAIRQDYREGRLYV